MGGGLRVKLRKWIGYTWQQRGCEEEHETSHAVCSASTATRSHLHYIFYISATFSTLFPANLGYVFAGGRRSSEIRKNSCGRRAGAGRSPGARAWTARSVPAAGGAGPRARAAVARNAFVCLADILCGAFVDHSRMCVCVRARACVCSWPADTQFRIQRAPTYHAAKSLRIAACSY